MQGGTELRTAFAYNSPPPDLLMSWHSTYTILSLEIENHDRIAYSSGVSVIKVKAVNAVSSIMDLYLRHLLAAVTH